MVKKIGLDFHGVIAAQPQNFAVFCHEIRKRGVKVYVISGGPKEDVVNCLKVYGIEYDEVWAILDNCSKTGDVKFYDDGTFQVPTEIWNKAKACYCEKEHIEFHIDDSNVYGQYFVTPYCTYNIGSGECSLNKTLKVDFKKPKEAVDIIMSFLDKTSN